MKIKTEFVIGNLGFSKTLKRSYTGYELEKRSFKFKKGWRVPTIKELDMLYEKEPKSHTHDWYWTSTPFACSGDYAWIINFYDGVDGYGYRSDSYFVRLVRGAE